MSKRLLKSTSLVSAMTLLSRILGFVRDMVVAHIFGATAGADAFYMAFKIPNFMRALFAEGSFTQAFAPVLIDYREHCDKLVVRQFISSIAGTLGILLAVITVLGIISAPLLINIFAPGLDEFRYHLATEMLRVTFPYLLFISLTAFVGAVLNSYHLFGIPAFTPALLNICMIGAAYSFTRFFHPPIIGLAWGVFVAGLVQLLFQLPFLHRLDFLGRPRVDWRNPGVQRVLKLMLPALFGASIGQISLLLNTIFASFLPVGSVSWLYYSDRLAYFPLGVFGVALATVVLPSLSRCHANQSSQEFAATLDWGIRCNLLIGLPASITMLILSGPLIVTLFYYGKFTVHDVLMTQRSVMAYGIGLQAFMLVKVLSSAFYAKHDVRTPVKIGVFALAVNMLLNAIFIFPLAHAGLALASSLASWFNTGLLIWLLYRRGIYQFQAGWGKFALQLLIANSVLVGVLLHGANDLAVWLSWHWQKRFLHVCMLGMFSIMLYISCLRLSGLRWQDLRIKATVAVEER